MKEIIAKRDKKNYIILLVISLISILGGLNLIRLRWLWLGVFGVAVFSLSAMLGLFFLLDKRGIITRDGETLIVLRGWRIMTIAIRDILDISQVPNKSKKGQFSESGLSITVNRGGKDTRIEVGDLQDAPTVIARLENIVKEYLHKTRDAF